MSSFRSDHALGHADRRGRYVVAVAREMIRNFRQGLENIARWSGSRRGRMTVAGLPSVACAVLPAAIRRFVQEHPDVEINVHDLPHERAIEDVENGIADLALTIRPAKLKECRFEELGADKPTGMPADHPLMKRKVVGAISRLIRSLGSLRSSVRE